MIDPTVLYDRITRWVTQNFFRKNEYTSTSSGTQQKARPVILGSNGKLSNTFLNEEIDTVEVLQAPDTDGITIKDKDGNVIAVFNDNNSVTFAGRVNLEIIRALDTDGITVQDKDGNTIAVFTDGNRLDISQILRALTSSGLRLEDDGGNLGVFVEDGGRVVVGGAANVGGMFNVVDVPTGSYGFIAEADSSGRGFQIQTYDYVFSSAGSALQGTFVSPGYGNVAWKFDAFTAGKAAAGNIVLQSQSGGKVGIGATPQYYLEVGAGGDTPVHTGGSFDGILVNLAGVIPEVSVRDATNNVETGTFSYSGGGVIGTWTNHPLIFRTNNANRITVGTDGSVVAEGTGLTYQGGEGADGIINLYADQGDDNADKWRMRTGITGSVSQWFLEYFGSGSWATILNITSTTFLVPTGIDFYAAEVYNDTAAAAANVNVGSGGRLRRSVSSRKYKTDIVDLPDKWGWPFVKQLRPVAFKSTCAADDPTTWHVGLIAEELADVSGGERSPYVEYGEDGSPEAIEYSRLVAPLILTVQQQAEAIKDLRQRVAALERAL